MDPISETPAIVEFGRFRILPHRRQLLIEGQPIRIGGRAFDVLLALIEARGAVVREDTLISRVWPNRNVEENAPQAQISALRDIFGADRDLIRRVRGRGYLFAGNLRDPLAGPLEQPIAASISADAALGEPRPRPCGWEPLAPLATVPAALVLAGSAFATMATPAKNAAPRTVDLQMVSI